MIASRLRNNGPEDRLVAIRELQEFTDPLDGEELFALIECLGDSRKNIQHAAAHAVAAQIPALSFLTEILGASIEAAPFRLRWGVVYALSQADRLSLSLLPTLLEAFGNDDGDVRWAAQSMVLRLARQAPGPVVAAVVEIAKSAEPIARKMALYALRDLAPHQAEVADVVLAAIAAKDHNLRLAAIAAYVRIDQDRGSVRSTLVALEEDSDPRIQRTAAAYLKKVAR